MGVVRPSLDYSHSVPLIRGMSPILVSLNTVERLRAVYCSRRMRYFLQLRKVAVGLTCPLVIEFNTVSRQDHGSCTVVKGGRVCGCMLCPTRTCNVLLSTVALTPVAGKTQGQRSYTLSVGNCHLPLQLFRGCVGLVSQRHTHISIRLSQD
jgi:hypothetical protein